MIVVSPGSHLTQNDHDHEDELSGYSRSTAWRRRRIRRSTTTGSAAPNTPKQHATVTVRVIASTRTKASSAQPTCAPASEPLTIYPVRIDGGRVYLALD